MKLIIISNRLPLKIVEEQNNFQIIPSQGGVATGLDSLDMNVEKHWVGWPGLYIEEPEKKEKINRQFLAQDFHPVYLTPEQIENYYEGYSNSVLWPLCHYFPTYMHYDPVNWTFYKEVNSLFAEEALKIASPEDVIWVQDYQLMLVPGLLREKRKECCIGYFHHIPFPSYELFRSLPERKEILKGLLGADLIEFHTYDYMRHFISTVYRILKLECRLDEIVLNDRVVDVDTFPMGINYDKYYQAISDSYIQKKAEELKESFGKNKIILSVDRLDYSKGISLRLKSFDEFLDTYPEYKGKNSLVMIVSPSRDQVDTYAELKNEIDQMVGAINGKHAMADWTPVYYFYRSFEFEELAALYNIAEIALVTPLRDGMNLVAKEYLAAKRDNCGVLILSEMAGAAVELTDAIIINPNNTKEIVEAIREVIEMPEDIQKEKLLSMQRIISEQTVEQWAKDFVYELRNVETNNKNHNKKIVGGDNLYTIKTAYKESTKRLFLLDYDGTLVAFNKDASKALPTSQLLDILSSLAENKKNHVVITSGRNYDFLDKYLGHLPIDMAAEHGASYKEDGVWHKKLEKIQWDNEIIHIFSHTIRKTPGSRMEIKDTALVWHYREVDSWLADLRVNQLIEALITPVGRNNLQIMKGNKIIEVKSNLVSKGTEAQRLIEKNDYDFILSVGDDTTDEEMFAALPEHAISIKVGKHTQSAKYTIPFQKQVLSVLAELQE